MRSHYIVATCTFVCLAASTVLRADTIMTIGDSITVGEPHGDGNSYHAFINNRLFPLPTWVGNPANTPSDTGAEMIGGDNFVISQRAVVGGPVNTAVFAVSGMLESFEAIKDTVVAPNFVVVMAGTYDLINLVAPPDVNDVFVPNTPNEYIEGGVFTDNDGASSQDHTVDPLIDRYNELLEALATQFGAAEIIVLPIPTVNTTLVHGGPGSQFDRARFKLAPTVSKFNNAITALMATKDDQFTFLDPEISVSDIVDGINLTSDGLLKIGFRVANLIRGNQRPILDPVGNQNVDEETLLTFTATASDPDVGDLFTFSLSGNVPAGASITADGVFTWTPPEAGVASSHTFEVVVRDDGAGTFGDKETITITVNEINQPPVLNAIGNKTVNEQAPLAFTATATDVDLPANNLTFTLSASAPAGASITPGGAFTWTPSEVQGGSNFTFDVIVTDDGPGNETDSETITVTVNELNNNPVLDPIGAMSVGELALLQFTATGVDVDDPQDGVTFSLSGAVPAGASISAAGVFTWTPTETQGPGSYTFDVVLTDDGVGNQTDSETITVTVTEVGQNPVLAAIGNQSTAELVALGFQATAVDNDLPAELLNFSLSGSVPSGASITPGGLFSWTPSESQGGSNYTFDVVVTDSSGGARTDSEAITVAVADVNVAPVLAPIGAQNVVVEGVVNFTATASDSDLPADALTFSLQGDVPAGASISSAGGFSWALSPLQIDDTYVFDVVVTDDGVGNLTDRETVQVNVGYEFAIMLMGDSLTSGFPHDPIQHPESYAGSLDTFLPDPGTYFGNPEDGMVDNGAAMVGGDGSYINKVPIVGGGPVTAIFPATGIQESFESISHTVIPEYVVLLAGTNDLLQLIAPKDGNDFFTPDSAGVFTGAGTFTIVDAGGSDTFRVDPLIDRYEALLDTIAAAYPPSTEVICLAGPPVDPAGTFGGAGSPFSMARGELALSVPVHNANVAALVGTKGPQFTFLDPQLTRADLHDGLHPNAAGHNKIGQALADFMLANNAPHVNSIPDQSVNEFQTLTFSSSASDSEGHNITLSLAGEVPAGATFFPNGNFNWTPTEAQSPGVYTIYVVATDDGPETRSGSEEVIVTVNEVNQDPVLDPVGSFSINELKALTFTVTATDSDLPADLLTFSLDGAVPAGATVSTTGAFSWTPTEAQAGMDHTFDVVVTDNRTSAGEDRETIVVTVNDVNSGPPRVIMTIGDSIISGFPNFDGLSVHSFLNNYLPTSYVGDPSSLSDSGFQIVGGSGNFINRAPVVGGNSAWIVFPANGVQEAFNSIKATVTVPEFVVILVGINDLMQLIAPKDLNDSFTPSVAGDFSSSGVYSDNGTDQPVDAMIDRYESLLDDVASTFGASTKILCIPLLPIDPTATFGGADEPFNRAKNTLGSEILRFNIQIETLIASKGAQFAFVEHGLTVAHIRDGIHPTDEGNDLLAQAIAGSISNEPPPANPFGDWGDTVFSASDLNDPAKEATVWGEEADPDLDGWSNQFEFYLRIDPLIPNEPDVTGAFDGSNYVVSFLKNADAPLGWVKMEYSMDMVNWFDLNTTVTNAMEPVEATLAVPSEVRVFFRLADRP